MIHTATGLAPVRKVFLLLLLLLPLARPAAAAESYDNCTGFITSLPTTITTQGTWCFKQDLSTAMTSGTAVTINTSNVTIDCNGYKLGGLAAGAGTTAYGIYASDRQNLTVRHCNVRGFYVGVDLIGSAGSGHVVEDNQFDGNAYVGVLVQGTGSVVRRNRVFDTGGSTAGVVDAIGVYAKTSVDVIDNLISGVTAPAGLAGNAFGIYSADLAGGTIRGNGLRGLLGDGAGHGYGIYNAASGHLSISENDVVGSGDPGSIGVYCNSNAGRAVGNNVGNFATGISICADVSGNNVTP
jgi:hypothetical protein